MVGSFATIERMLHSINLKNMTKSELIQFFDSLIFFQREMAKEILSRKDCDEGGLLYVLKNSIKEPQVEAAKRLIKGFPSRENLGLIIRHCMEMRGEALRLLEIKFPVDAEAVFWKNIKA